MRKSAAIYVIALALAFAQSAFAQARTTPVEVKNTPSVSVSNTPNVAVSNSPTVKIDATANTVKAQQSGAWSVGITGTPGVNVANTPTVRIDATTNTVQTLSRYRIFFPWASDTTLVPYETLSTGKIDVTGYKEVRAVFRAGSGTGVLTYVAWPDALRSIELGWFTFSGPTTSITNQANWAPQFGLCMFVAPVMAPTIEFIYTNTSLSTVYSDSYVYLVN